MQPTKLLLALTASTLLITGCTNQKTPATSAVSQAETAVNEIKFEAEKFAPTELKTTEATLAKLKADLASEDYKGVIAGVPQFNKDIAALKEIGVPQSAMTSSPSCAPPTSGSPA